MSDFYFTFNLMHNEYYKMLRRAIKETGMLNLIYHGESWGNITGDKSAAVFSF